MARIRSIKPEFWTDEKVVALSPLARLLFIGLWNFADDWGRGEYSPIRLKMQILPADPADILQLLGEIRREELIVVYDVAGRTFFGVTNFAKHQKIDKRAASKHPIPPTSTNPPQFPPTSADTPPTPPSPTDTPPLPPIPAEITPTSSDIPQIPPTERKGKERIKEREGKRKISSAGALSSSSADANDADFDQTTIDDDDEFGKIFWPVYPHKVGKKEAIKSCERVRRRISIDVIMAGLDRYIETKPEDRPWMNPATFLNGERWNDEPAPQNHYGAQNGNSRHDNDIIASMARVVAKREQARPGDRRSAAASNPPRSAAAGRPLEGDILPPSEIGPWAGR